jgi:HEAT repeat protein
MSYMFPPPAPFNSLIEVLITCSSLTVIEERSSRRHPLSRRQRYIVFTMPLDLPQLRERLLRVEERLEWLKLLVIALFAVISLMLTVYLIQNPGNTQFAEIYQLLPHLYILPIIMVAFWYPKRGLQITLILIISIAIFTIMLYAQGVRFDPIMAFLNAGLDISVFVVLALYVKDRNLVESVLTSFFEHGEYRSALLEVHEAAERAKSKFSGDFDEIVKALQSTDDDIREEAVRALCELSDPRAVTPLIQALQDENRYVRREAAKSLGHLGDDRALVPLIQALKDEDRYAREGAAEGLAEMGGKAVGPLLKALRDPDWHVRMGAVIALRIIGSDRANEPLIEALSDESRFVRREAVKSLGRIGDEKVIDPLIHSLKDEDSSVRIRAVASLAKFSGARVIDVLIDALQDPDGSVRLRAIQALEEIRDPRGLEAVRNNGTSGRKARKPCD